MIGGFLDWLDARTDYRALLAPLRCRVLLNGPSWWFTSASCLLWVFVIQLVTGLLLMTKYSPSTTSAWASVHFIEQSPSGAFVRGLHYFASHLLILLFVVHVVRVLLSGAFRPPRELIWITGLLLMPLVIAWAVTGNPLSASQKGTAQIEVEANILGSTPLVGSALRRLLLGGDDVGHLTLTHLYFLHVALLPLLGIVLLAVHLHQVYRHGLTTVIRLPFMALGKPSGHARPYWPYQSVRNATVLVVLVSALAALAWRWGAPLEAPADPNLTIQPRPEWYFRSLFELRRYFTGEWEFVATLVLPLALLTFFIAIPLFDRVCPPKLGLTARLFVVAAGLGVWGWLTWNSYARDWRDPEYLAAQDKAAGWARRARLLADRGRIPPEGAAALLRGDPKVQGPLLFARHCASCHSHADPRGEGIVAAEPSAPNLFGFGTPDWIEGMLDPRAIGGANYFGHTKFADGDMASHVREWFADVSGDDAAELRAQARQVARALAAEAALPARRDADLREPEAIAGGAALLTDELGCTDCHKFHDQGELGSAPDLTGYGSREWLMGMIADPQGERFYGPERNDRMPSFAKGSDANGSDANRSDANGSDQAGYNLLHQRELELLVDWLRGDWVEHAPEPNDP